MEAETAYDWANLSLGDLAILRTEAQAFVTEADKHIAIRVAQSRVAGGSWAEIGKVLGITRQAAQQKFSL